MNNKRTRGDGAVRSWMVAMVVAVLAIAIFALSVEKNEVVILRLGTDTAPDSHESRGRSDWPI